MKNFSHSMSLCSICLISGLLISVVSFAGEHGSKWDKDTHFKMMDSNADGKVSSTEHSAAEKKMFGKMDANMDGKVTASEMDASSKAMGSHDSKSGAMKDDGMKDGMKHDGMDNEGKRKVMSSAEKIKVFDTDGDGMVSAEEHAAGSRAMFSKMDTDKDGSLTAAEITNGHEKMMTARDKY